MTPFNELCVRIMAEKKAENISVLKIKELSSISDYFILCTVSNSKQAQAIADHIEKEAREKLNSRPMSIEGYTDASWILLDYADCVVHVFQTHTREQYSLDSVWRAGTKMPLPKDIYDPRATHM